MTIARNEQYNAVNRPTLNIALVDPSRYAPNYDEALGAPMRAAGHKLRLHARAPRPDEPDFSVTLEPGLAFYRVSERFSAGRVRKIGQLLKIPEHALDLVRLARRVIRDNCDVVHVQWLVVPLLDGVFLRWASRHMLTVTTVHNSNPVHGAARWSPQRFAMTWAQAGAHRVVGHTKFTAEQLQKRGISTDRIAVIPFGLLGEGATVRETGAHSTHAADPVRILAFGRLRPYKALDLLLDAIAGLESDVLARTRLHVAGSPMMEVGGLRRQAAELGIDHVITWDLHFLSEDEVIAAFASADVLALPYRDVDASAVLRVGQQHGLPAIATAVGGFDTLIEHGVTGLKIGVDDQDALTRAITLLVTDHALRESLSEGVRSAAASLPTWDQISSITVELFHEAIEAHQLAGVR